MIIKNELYNGEVNLVFDNQWHAYSIDGRKVKSVTKGIDIIAKPALVNWAANTAVEYLEGLIKPGMILDEVQLLNLFKDAKQAHRVKKENAGNLGSLLHDWISRYIKGENPPTPINEGLHKSVEKFKKWEVDNNVKFLKSEQPIYSRKYDYAGTLDFICTIDGELYLGDVKTSSAIYDTYWMQVAAYRQARMEEFPGENYIGQAIIRIGKDGSFAFAKSQDFDKYFEAFRLAFELSNQLERLKV
jgi:cytochrome c2